MPLRLPGLDGVAVAGAVAVVYLTAAFLVGHVVSSPFLPLPTLSEACPHLSASSSPSVGREMHGYSLEVWGVESWAPLK